MEEKLYFKPAKYGKGIKKKEKPKETTDGGKDHRVRNLIFFLLFLAIIILIILWLLHGETTTSGQYPENVSNESLVCINKTLTPEKINSINSREKEIKLNIVFNGSETMKRIYFTYTLVYSDDNEAYGAEAKSHAFFNESLVASGYSTDKFSNKFSRYNEKLTISLTATSNEIDEFSAPYFMIKTDSYGWSKPESIEDFQENYESQGFACSSSEQEKE